MNLESGLFDPIRISDHEDAALNPTRCNHYGCAARADYKAPIGREREGEYYHFCFEHVKAYNQRYNYFAGMSVDDLLNYQREAITGLRPTWKMGQAPSDFKPFQPKFGFEAGQAQEQPKQKVKESRFTPMVRRCFEALALEHSATAEEITLQYKNLIKRLHPDANGGDRSTEDQFRAVIEAYDTLKSCGFC